MHVAFIKDKVCKMHLIERIHRRKKLLKRLRRRDIEKFRWLTTELELDLLPDPTPTRMKLYKREKRELAAKKTSDEIVARKTEELRRRLAAERESFDEYKQAELADIERSLSELGIKSSGNGGDGVNTDGPMGSFEGTMRALGAEDLIPKTEIGLPPRRIRKLNMLFEVYGEQKRKRDAEILEANGFIVPRSLTASSGKKKPSGATQ